MKKTLAKFCKDDPVISSMATPWSAGEYSCATNGHILCRIPRRGDIPERDDAPRIDSIFDIPAPKEWFPLADIVLPALVIKEVICSDCNGVQGEDHVCPECDGRGLVDFTNSYSDYEVDCKSCDGEGKIHKCEKCNGTGKVVIENLQPVQVGSSHFQLRYLLLLKDLPNCKIGPAAPSLSLQAARFVFDGGEGLLMPMNV